MEKKRKEKKIPANKRNNLTMEDRVLYFQVECCSMSSVRQLPPCESTKIKACFRLLRKFPNCGVVSLYKSCFGFYFRKVNNKRIGLFYKRKYLQRWDQNVLDVGCICKICKGICRYTKKIMCYVNNTFST